MANIGENSNVKLSLVISIVAAIGSMFWWARGIQSATESSELKVAAVEKVQREDIKQMHEALSSLQQSTARTAAQVSLLVSYFGANSREVGPPASLMRKRALHPGEDDQ